MRRYRTHRRAHRAPSTAALVIASVLALSPVSVGQATSLWSEESHSLYSNRKASRVGDVITVQIVESSTGFNRAATSSSKEDDHSLDAQGSGPLDFIPLLGYDFGSKVEFKGKASSSVAAGLNARISAQVVDILPNGHLVISGQRRLTVNGEEEEITVAGEVRPEDVRANNTVLSTNIANATIEYAGTGPATQSVKRGILHRLFGWLF